MREWKAFSANYCHYCLVNNISHTNIESAWDAQLYHVLHLDAALLYSSRYSFIVLKQTNVFFCTRWYQNISFNFALLLRSQLWAPLSCGPAVTCWTRVINWKYQRGTPPAAARERLRNRWLIMFLFQTKNVAISSSVETLSPKQPTNFGMKSQSFVLAALVVGEQFKQSEV